jgi:hypothetical protein
MTSDTEQDHNKQVSTLSPSAVTKQSTPQNTEVGFPVRGTGKKDNTPWDLSKHQSALSASSPRPTEFMEGVNKQDPILPSYHRDDKSFQPEYDFEFECRPKREKYGEMTMVDPDLQSKYNTAMSYSPLKKDRDRVTARYSRIDGWNPEWAEGNTVRLLAFRAHR